MDERTRIRLLTRLEGLEERAKALGISLRRWMMQAEVAESTFYRWKQRKTSPQWETLERLERVLVFHEAAKSSSTPGETAALATAQIAAN